MRKYLVFTLFVLLVGVFTSGCMGTGTHPGEGSSTSTSVFSLPTTSSGGAESSVTTTTLASEGALVPGTVPKEIVPGTYYFTSAEITQYVNGVTYYTRYSAVNKKTVIVMRTGTYNKTPFTGTATVAGRPYFVIETAERVGDNVYRLTGWLPTEVNSNVRRYTVVEFNATYDGEKLYGTVDQYVFTIYGLRKI